MNKENATVWQKWNRASWLVKSIQFWAVGFIATYLFIVAGLSYNMAALAGLFGVNAIIFVTTAYLAGRDDKKAPEE